MGSISCPCSRSSTGHFPLLYSVHMCIPFADAASRRGERPIDPSWLFRVAGPKAAHRRRGAHSSGQHCHHSALGLGPKRARRRYSLVDSIQKLVGNPKVCSRSPSCILSISAAAPSGLGGRKERKNRTRVVSTLFFEGARQTLNLTPPGT